MLFTSSVFRLRQTGTTVPSYLMALAPVLAGRESIGGTFQHWTPISTYYWHGSDRPRMMTERTDLKDDQTIFGLPWRAMDEAALLAALRKLNVTDVVATEYDLWTRTYLDRSPAFEVVLSDPQYNIYRVRDYAPTLIESDRARLRAVTDHGAIRVQVDRAEAGAEALLKQTYFPLWTAESTVGPVAIEPDKTGLTLLRLPEGVGYEVTLRYLPGPAERLGTTVSLAALAVIVGIVALSVASVVVRPSAVARRVGG
ncbi:MAG: hypothetical protein KatS3mg060_3472 [Dehalococcoidia bacterium]|nr:MAG: hypothetical protein KatS3mg060_3472 [Dehalococcoidia bacterium]